MGSAARERPPAVALELRVPAAPTVRGVLRTALNDFFYNSWRLVPANVIWGAGLIIVLGLSVLAPLIGLIALFALALPTAGIFRLAALISRSEPVSLSDAIRAWRQFLVPALATGVVVGGAAIVLVFNILSGFLSAELIGWAFATLALWGFAALISVALAFWPLLVDPVRQSEPLRARIQLAAAVILSSPGRFVGLLLVVSAITVISTILFAALLSVTIAYVALVMCRYVLPAADRLEGRRTDPEPVAY